MVDSNDNAVAPSDKAIIERTISLCSECCYTIALQCRRLRSDEPEDKEFIFRWWADLQFLIIALRRLKASASILEHISIISDEIRDAIAIFNDTLPALATMRNVGEHIEQYALDSGKRHHKNISRRQLQIGSFDGTVYKWLDGELNIDKARAAADKLFLVVQQVRGKI